MKSKQNTLVRITKFLAYILGRHPDEFGLVTDENGFVKIKNLLKAITEEPDWGFIRLSHLKEVSISVPVPPFEMIENRIRAVDRERLPKRRIAEVLPKLLYTCVRQRAYPYVSENGIGPASSFGVILSEAPAMAKRIGHRADPKAVLLTVKVSECQRLGVHFFTAGQGLFTADKIPPGGFTGPPVPKEPFVEKAESKPVCAPKEPGSYRVRLDEMGDQGASANQKSKNRKTTDSTKGRKRRDRFDRERPPWRR